MLRVVLAVLLAVALLAVTTPALEDARTTRTERLTERELGRVESAALTLAREEDPGARRSLGITLPDGSPTAAPLEFVALGGVPSEGAGIDTVDSDVAASRTAGDSVVAYRVAGGRRHVRRLGLDLRLIREGSVDSWMVRQGSRDSREGHNVETGLRMVRSGNAVDSDAPAIVLSGGGTYRLTLRLVRLDGTPTVTVSVKEM